MTADTFRPASFRAVAHDHVFLDDAHQRSERKVWAVIGLCVAMMMVEIGGGLYFGSIALVADGLHMSTHAGALLLAALAYTYARRHAHDPRFSFGTGKLGDLAGFTSATVLAMIALLIGYEAVSRILSPVPIHFGEAIPIACLGLAVNVASAWLLGGGDHHHGHGHSHDHSHAHGHSHSHAHGETHSHDETHRIPTRSGTLALELFEDGVPPRFRLRAETGPTPAIASASMSSLIETIRPDGSRQRFTLVDRGTYLESLEEVPEPHDFVALLRIDGGEHALTFEEPDTSDDAHRDNNMRAALVHVVADAAVSVLVIVGLVLAQSFGWLWMDPLAGVVGAAVIASWSYGLIRDTGTILLDITPDRRLLDSVRDVIEDEGDALTDLHVWRLGPGHLGAIVSVRTDQRRGPDHYRAKLARFRWLSHLTVEVQSV